MTDEAIKRDREEERACTCGAAGSGEEHELWCPWKPHEEQAATFQGYLLSETEKGHMDFDLRVVFTPDGGMDFYIHPSGADGSTGDFEVSGNVVLPIEISAGSAR